MNAQEKKLKAERAARLRAAGLCLSCGSRPVGTNQDGSTSVRCDECKEPTIPSGRVTMAKLKDVHKPVSMNYEGCFYDYRDEKPFKTFRNRVKTIIAKHGPLTSREIKAVLGEYDPTHLAEALHCLMGEIEEIGITVVRYQMARTVRRIEVERYNNRNNPAQPSDRTNPYALMDGSRPNVTS